MTVIQMSMMNTDLINTSTIPKTLPLLKTHLPSILLAQCFNDENIPFAVELQRTETGHLFEHILLEYLCKFKLARGASYAAFSGRTYWNWKRDPKGTFQIVVRTGYINSAIFPIALEHTIQLMKTIIQSTYTPSIESIHPLHQKFLGQQQAH